MASTYSTCIIEGCEKPGKAARGMCWMHYARGRRGKRAPKRLENPRGATLYEGMDHIGWDVTESGCWEWRGNRYPNGYGRYSFAKWGVKLEYVHRLMYERYVGPIPEGLLIRHKCDNPPCSNPEHLDVGTVSDNSRDMVERGRARNAYSLGAVRYGSDAGGREVTKCRKRGHDITAEDALLRYPDGKVKCRACLPLDHAEARSRRFRNR